MTKKTFIPCTEEVADEIIKSESLLKEGYYEAYALPKKFKQEDVVLCLDKFRKKFGAEPVTILATQDTAYSLGEEIMNEFRVRIKRVVGDRNIWVCDREE